MEDLKNQAGAGLYDSVLNVSGADVNHVKKAITDVWLSLFTKRAVLSRRQLGNEQQIPLMAILVQEQVSPAYSFIVHTRDPFTKGSQGIYAELAVGLGETLASGGQPGLPYKMSTSGKGDACEVTLGGFANYSKAVVPAGAPRDAAVDYS